MAKFEITTEQAQPILDYLASRPYGEVFKVVVILLNLKEIKENPMSDEQQQPQAEEQVQAPEQAQEAAPEAETASTEAVPEAE